MDSAKPLSPESTPQENMSKWVVLGTVMVSVFMSVLDGSIVTVALPKMIDVFRIDADAVRMVVELYAVAYAISTLTASWLHERIGIKRTFIGGLVLFTIASFLCGRAWDINSMVAFRILQGLGAGIMLPAGMTLVTESFRPEQRGTAFGIFGIVIVFAPTIGPTLGGYLVDFADWRYIFLINIPIGVLNLALAYFVLKEMKERHTVRFDLLGFIGLSVFISCMLVALSHGQRVGWSSPYIVSLVISALIGFSVFMFTGLRSENPVLKLALFQNFHFTIVSILNFMRSSSLFARIFLAPLFFQTVAGFSAMSTGLIITVGAIAAGITNPIAGFLVDRYGPKFFFFAGFIFMGISNVAYYTLDVDSSYAAILIPMLLFGIGAGMLNSPIMSTSMNVVDRRDIGQVSTIITVFLEVGAAFGVALIGTAVTVRTAFHENAVTGFQDGFLYIGIFSFLAVIPALGLLGMKSFTKKAPADNQVEKV